MPLTPYHFGFAMIIFALFPFIDPFAIFIGTVIIDIEGILYILFNIGVPHGYSHSLLGVIIYFLPCMFFSWLIYFILEKIFKKPFKFNWLLSLLSSILGLISHIIFDAFLYPEMMILYPFSKTTGHLVGLLSYSTTRNILIALFFIGLGIFLIKILIKYGFKKPVLISYNFQKGIAKKESDNEKNLNPNTSNEEGI